MGEVTLSQIFNLAPGTTIFIVVTMALLGFSGAEKLEKKFWPRKKIIMTFNRILASVALLLAGGALIVQLPERNAFSDPSSLAALIESEKDHIEPLELARSIKDMKQNIQLIDLRDSTEFARYHIPGARAITLTTLVNGGVHRNENIVIYSQGGTHAARPG